MFERALFVNYHNQRLYVSILRKCALPYIFKTNSDGFLVSNNDFKNIPQLLSWKKCLKLDLVKSA